MVTEEAKREMKKFRKESEDWEDIPMEPITDEVREKIYKQMGVDPDAPIHNDVLSQLKEDGKHEVSFNENQLLDEAINRPEKFQEYMESQQHEPSTLNDHLHNKDNMKRARIDGIKSDLEYAKMQVAGYQDVGQKVPQWLNKKIEKLAERLEDEN